jgi:c-di-GMP-binding flagellar brake protein YcgR
MSDSATSPWKVFGGDRRRFPRKFLSGTAHLLLPDRAPVEVHALDISVGGMGIVAPTNLTYEFRCEIRFTLAREPFGIDVVTAPVQVVHCVLSGREHGFLIGLQFFNLPDNVAAVIGRFMGTKNTTLDLGSGEVG